MPAPDEARGARVVLGRGEEVQPRSACGGDHLGRSPPAVGVHRVQVQVAAVPPPSRAGDRSRSGAGLEVRPGPAEVERHGQRPLDTRRDDRDRAEDHVPASRADRSREVSRCRPTSRDPERPPRAARPPTEPGRVAEVLPGRVEHPDVDHVGAHPGRRGRRLVVVGHLDLPHAARHLDRDVVPVGSADAGEPSRPGAGAATPGSGRLEEHRRRGSHRDSRRARRTQERATAEAGGVVVLAHVRCNAAAADRVTSSRAPGGASPVFPGASSRRTLGRLCLLPLTTPPRPRAPTRSARTAAR